MGLARIIDTELSEFGFERGDPLTPLEKKELIRRLVTAVDSYERSRDDRAQDLFKMLKGVLSDYADKPELGMMAIRELLKGR